MPPCPMRLPTSTYTYSRAITFNHAEVPNTDQQNFPVLISGTYADFANVSNGGKVQSLQGYDIVFTSDSAGQNFLDHEIDTYNSATGALNFWVRIPTLSHSVDTTIYMWFGNSAATFSQEYKTGVWSNGYAAVYHMGNGTVVSGSDSLGHNSGTVNNVSPASGVIGGGGSFGGSSSISTVPASSVSGSFTIEEWAKPNTTSGRLGLYGSRTPFDGSFDAKLYSGGIYEDIGSGSSWFATSANVSFPYSINMWHFFAHTATTNIFQIYDDGIQIGTGTFSGTPLLLDSNHDLLIGQTGISGEGFLGSIDEARVSTVVRSADWIATEYNNQNSPGTFLGISGESPTVVSPQITNVSPLAVSPGTSMTINGTGFGATQQSGTVVLNNTIGAVVTWSNSQIVVTVPTGTSPGTLYVQQNGVNSNAVQFTINPVAPSISGLSPSIGSAGTLVTISGTAFGATQGSGSVLFSAVTAGTSNWSDTSITAIVPAGVSSGSVVVRSGNGLSSNAASFTVPTPHIASISPTSAGGGSLVTIIGSNFGQTGGSVNFNGTTATVTSWSDTQVVALVPASAASGPVFVVAGSTSNGVTFTVIPGLNVGAISPSTGPINTMVTVSGANFGNPQGTGTIKFNGVSGVPTSWSSSAIVVPVPVGATTGPVVVSAGGSVGNGPTFTVTAGPSIAQLSPTTGAPGTSVTITGTNFGVTQGSSIVRFNGRTAAITSWGATSIQATAPVGLTTGPVTVTVSGQTSNGLTFTAVTNGTLAGTVSNASGGAGISGATVQALQNGVVKSSALTAGDGTYSMNNLTAGNYDIQVSASSFGTGVRNSVSVLAGQTAMVNVSLSAPSTISGSISQSNGTTPIPGASIQLFVGSAPGNKTSADANGNYSIAGLNAASYTLQASATGYVTKSQTATLAAGSTTTANFALQATGMNPINYVYDELGRLISVTDSSGDTAVYQYDSVGNILSISRYASSQVSIVSFTPRTGYVGASVVINGTGFSTTASQNTVQFNGVAATVILATSTQISTTVPSGATTGPITVSTPNGSAVSTLNFTVGAAAGAPTITGFQPSSATIGSTFAIFGTNFYTAANNKLTLNTSRPYATNGTSTQINTTVPPSTASGRISVTTPDGKATSTQDFYIPFGSHQAADIGYTARFSFGNSQTVSLSAGKIALLLFDASAGQGASLQLSGSTFPTCTIYIFGPNGSQLTSSSCTSSTTLVSSVGLPSTGTYTIGIDPGTGAGSISVALDGDFVSTITIPAPGQTGPAVRVPASGDLIVGQYGRLTFNGTAGQKISVNVLASTIGAPTYYLCGLTLYDPNNNFVTSSACGYPGNFFMDTVTLATTGKYLLVVAPASNATGNVSLSLNNDADVTGTINIDGSAVTTTTTVGGQDARLSFSANAGQRIVLYATNVTNVAASVYLVRPDGTNQTSIGFGGSPSGQTFFMDTQPLATAGTYQLWVQHSVGQTRFGSETLQIASVPADFTFATSVPPAGQTGPTIRVPGSGDLAAGQNAMFTFSGTTGQSVSFNVLSSTIGTAYYSCFVSLYDPNGNSLPLAPGGTPYCGSTGNFFMGPVTLGANGTYSLLMDPGGAATGNVSVSMNNDATVTGTISIDGPAVTTATTAAGQDAQLGFSATAGQRIVLFATNVTNKSATVQLVRPDGSNQASLGFSNNPSGQTFYMDTQTLVAGPYTLWVQHYPALNFFGSQTLQLASVPPDVSGSVTVGGSAYSFTTVVGQNANITFSNSQSQPLTVRWTNGTYPSSAGFCGMTVTGPSPSTSTVAHGYCDGATGSLSLGTPPAGTYNILVDAAQQNTGGLSLTVTTP